MLSLAVNPSNLQVRCSIPLSFYKNAVEQVCELKGNPSIIPRGKQSVV